MNKDELNRVISEWRGECRHGKWQGRYSRKSCGYCGKVYYANSIRLGKHKQPDYTDPSAWDETLYGEIEEKGLADAFTGNLKEISVGHRIASLTTRHCMRLLKSTPYQKALALYKAIIVALRR